MYRVVIVDDEYIVVEGIKTIIGRENMNFEVIGCAYNGVEGKELIEKENPDVVISDIRMPGKTGLEMIEELTGKVKAQFIIISGYQEFEYARKALQLGVKAYIDKPITVNGVKESLKDVEEILDQKSQVIHNKMVQQRKKEYQEARETLISMVTNDDYEDGPDQVDVVLMALRACDYELEALKKECYTMVCLATGIYFEKGKEKGKEHRMPLYENIKNLEKYEMVEMFVKEMFKSIFEKIKVTQIGRVHKTIEKVLLYLEEHYQEDIGLSEIAEMVDMHYTYLSILFKEEVGMSFIKYLTGIRMENARRLLREGYKVGEVAEMTGYSNYRYFCDIFKKNEGMTPNEYKGNVRKGK